MWFSRLEIPVGDVSNCQEDITEDFKMGIKLCKGMVLLLVLLVITSSCSKSNEQIIAKEVSKMKSELPVKFGDNVTLVKVEAGENEIISTYEIRGVDKSKIDDALISKLKSTAVSQLKNDRDIEKFFKRGIGVRIICTDETEDELLSFTILREDLG